MSTSLLAPTTAPAHRLCRAPQQRAVILASEICSLAFSCSSSLSVSRHEAPWPISVRAHRPPRAADTPDLANQMAACRQMCRSMAAGPAAKRSCTRRSFVRATTPRTFVLALRAQEHARRSSLARRRDSRVRRPNFKLDGGTCALEVYALASTSQAGPARPSADGPEHTRRHSRAARRQCRPS